MTTLNVEAHVVKWKAYVTLHGHRFEYGLAPLDTRLPYITVRSLDPQDDFETSIANDTTVMVAIEDHYTYTLPITKMSGVVIQR